MTTGTKYKFRYWKGVKYVAPHNSAPPEFARCGSCGRAWDDDKPSEWTPTPSGRCPFECWHKDETQGLANLRIL